MNTDIKIAAGLIRQAQQIVVFTGAGISTPSGIPDFRSAESGLWTRYDPMEVASLSAFRRNPEKFFNWLRPMARKMVDAQPNPAHLALAKLDRAGYPVIIVTQNIDGLHTRAGNSRIIEVHGTFRTFTCTSCYRTFDSQPFIAPFIDQGTIPRCPDCQATLKPDVILFEEQLPYQAWQEAMGVSQACDLMLVAGSSLEVLPAAGLPRVALESRAKLIVINKTPTYINPRATVVLSGDVATIIPQIVSEVLHE